MHKNRGNISNFKGVTEDLKHSWKSIQVVLGRKGVVDGKIDPEFRKESIVLLCESKVVSQEATEYESNVQMV